MRRSTRLLLGVGAIGATAAAAGLALADDGWGHGWGRHGGGMTLFESFDTNADGKLTQAEIDTARDGRFDQFDTDRDGRLTLQEYQGLWLDAMRRPMVRQFQGHDVDGDATLTKDEFRERYERIIVRMDRNGDGEITIEELHRGRGDDRRGPGRRGDGPPDSDDDDG